MTKNPSSVSPHFVKHFPGDGEPRYLVRISVTLIVVKLARTSKARQISH